ncbi:MULTISPECIES: zinc-binding alcohol dehydrogenase family protein [unclassified Agarivorans]|uniref:zinc-binding alcohol dehydrogenase family protein n=1 Tax=unclassified Agarivorans TaxID=2636026 RepID=UPI0026E189C8|nr:MULTISPECIES: zinc-binding alcohol dehydrogenase family protein [unclassified Agarivorans]MDO6683919.1 zinc-binding alcohol dehydrogenase family protein [Agarivorans sp. 3_MG-2023]MDO6714348.1 zinc-binding alcohol dehydrogenase family protein [Agarivorans sp. 2_MG-2023]
MKAVAYQQALAINEALSLQDIELDKPTASGKDLLIKVAAVSVNPVDTKIRANVSAETGQWKVIGWDAVGTVEQVGDKASLFKVGDKVWYAGDLTRSGSNAEYQLVDERIVSLAPTSIPDANAAALPLTAITAWEMLFDRLVVSRDQHKSILIIGAAGGVGSIMVQLVKQLTKLKVIATASRPETQAWLKELGADQIINHRNPLSEELKQANNIDYVVSLNNTDEHLAEIMKVIKPQGKFGLIDDPSSLDVKLLKPKSISLHWEFMYTRSMFETEDMIKQHQLLGEIAQLIDQGKIKSTLGDHFGQINADNLKQAHAFIESQKAKGKIVLEGF